MLDYGIDLVVAVASLLLLISGVVKVVVPGPITATLAALWSQATGRMGRSGPPLLGRLLGLGEIALAAWIVLGRSALPAVALTVFASGLAVAGLMGALGSGHVPCACFGGHDRALGYLHAAQLPLWVVAAWCVWTRTELTAGLDGRVAVLAAAAAAASVFHVARMWTALAPTAKRRRQEVAALASGAPTQPQLGGSSW